MTIKVPRGDRREHVRFEVSGQFWASLNFANDDLVRDLAPGGVSVETLQRSAIRQIRAVRITLPGGPTIDAIVRHVSRELAGSADGPYVVGLEFVNLSPAARLFVERVVREWQAGADS